MVTSHSLDRRHAAASAFESRLESLRRLDKSGPVYPLYHFEPHKRTILAMLHSCTCGVSRIAQIHQAWQLLQLGRSAQKA